MSANEPVRVSDPPDQVLATGRLGAGVLAGADCNFPFEISGVAGGHTTYSIMVGARTPVSFPAADLRQDKPAVLTFP